MWTKVATITIAAILIVLAAIFGYRRGLERAPVRTETVTDTIYVDKPVDLSDVNVREPESFPERLIIYRDSVQVIYDTVRVPVVIRDNYRISSTSPIRVETPRFFGQPRVYWTSFDPDSGRWEQRQYVVPESPWSYGAEFESGFVFPASGMQPFAMGRVYAGYKRVEPFAGVVVNSRQTAPFVGVRFKIGRD